MKQLNKSYILILPEFSVRSNWIKQRQRPAKGERCSQKKVLS